MKLCVFVCVCPGVCPTGDAGGRRDAGEVLQRELAHHQRTTDSAQRLRQVQDPQVRTHLYLPGHVTVKAAPGGVACYRSVELRVL